MLLSSIVGINVFPIITIPFGNLHLVKDDEVGLINFDTIHKHDTNST